MKPSARTQFIQLVRVNLLEALRRKDAYVLLLLTSIFLGFCLTQRWMGIENPATGTFLLNLALTLAMWAAHLAAILFGARQLSTELETRTFWTLMARPLPLSRILLAKWFSATLAGWLVGGLLLLGSFLCVPVMEAYNPVTAIQMMSLGAVSVAVFAALALPFSLWWPQAGAVAAAVGWFLISGFVAGQIQQAPAGIRAVGNLLPDGARFLLVTRFTDGLGPASLLEVAGLGVLGILYVLFFLGWSLLLLEKKRG